MAKIIFYFPGNGLHSFLIEDRFERMYKEQLGIKEIGKCGFPVAMSHQGIDYELFPFLKEVHEQYDNIELVSAPFGHGPHHDSLHAIEDKPCLPRHRRQDRKGY